MNTERNQEKSKAHDRIFLPSFIPGTRRVQKRFEKTRSRMVYHAILGAWGTPQQATDGSYWPSGHCLPIIKHDIGKHCLPIIKHDIGKHCLLIIRNDIRKPRLRKMNAYEMT